jgi:hypothetical protein
MKGIRLLFTLIVTLILSAVCFAQNDLGGGIDFHESSSEKPNLLDEFGRLPECDLRGRYDLFLSELSQNPASQGYVMLYQGTDVLPANYDSPAAERMIRNHLMFRGFDHSRVTVINGGFREEGFTQLWMVPPGAVPPSPENALPKPEIPTNKTFLFDRDYLALEEEDQEASEYILQSYKDELEADRKKWEEEYRLERIANGEQDVEIQPEPEPEAEQYSEIEQDESKLTEEEELESKFSWLSDSFGSLLAERPASRGVIIFYADDERFDIQKIRGLIEEGVERLHTSAELKGTRIEVVFGGYRSSTDVEYWVIPEDGIDPVPTPEEREVEEVAVEN